VKLGGLAHLESVQPIHIAAFIEELELSKPTIKQHLAALRMLFDWLVVGHIIETNPAHAVRGPKHSVRKGKTPVLTAEEARTLLDSIPFVRIVKLKGGGEKDVPYVTGMRDRALIGLMVFTFARVGAAVGMRVEDYFIPRATRMDSTP
jgi:site-specific recombinase XerD